MTEGAAGLSRIVLLAALPQEVRPFLRRTKARRHRGLPWPAWEFALGVVRGLLVLSGMGARAAREAAARLTAQFHPHLLVSLGFGGAVTPELEPGDLVLGTAVYQYDPASQVLEAVPAPQPSPPVPELLQALTADGRRAFAGSLVTTPYIIHKAGQVGPLRSLPAPVLDLESAAVAAVAQAEGLPFFGIRAITDAASEEIPDFMVPVGEPSGTVGLLEVLGWLAADPRRLKDLIHLGRRCGLAAPRLAKALLVLLPRLVTPGNLPGGED